MLARTDPTPFVLLPLILACCQSQEESRPYDVLLIDNMDRDPLNARFQWGPNEEWRGLWYASTEASHYQVDSLRPSPKLDNSDDCSGWTFDWIPDEDRPPADDNFRYRPGGYAAHLRTAGPGLLLTPASPGGQGMDWGETDRVWGANMSIDLLQPGVTDGGLDVDSSAGLDAGAPVVSELCPLAGGIGLDLKSGEYSGLGFWAKASIGSEQTIHVQLQDVNSDRRGGRCVKASASPAEVKEYCYNGFAKPITLTGSFTRYEVDFLELRRDPNWGSYPLAPLSLNDLYLLSFEVRSPKCIAADSARCVGEEDVYLSFDFWIDAVYLYKR